MYNKHLGIKDLHYDSIMRTTEMITNFAHTGRVSEIYANNIFKTRI